MSMLEDEEPDLPACVEWMEKVGDEQYRQRASSAVTVAEAGAPGREQNA
jgi:hypothetical protein